MVKIYGKSADEISTLLQAGQITIDLVGIGNMGLPVAIAFAKEGAKVIGVRTDQSLVDQINRGVCPLLNEPQIPEMLQEVVRLGRFRATTDGKDAASKSDVIILLVPLLVDSSGREDYSIIRSATKLVGQGLMKGDLVITSTTMPPGATEQVVKPILEEESGLAAGKDFGLAHSPERLMVGYVLRNLKKFPKVIGGIDAASTEAAAGVYGVFGTVERTSSLIAAELVKVAEGTFRDVNIAYANFLAKLCEPLGVDVWEIIHAANKETSEHCMIHRPSAGVGGHCIPVYPWFLINKAKELKINESLVRFARFLNDSMSQHTINLVIHCLNAQGKALKGAQISLLGVSFRANVKEIRFAASLQLLKCLQEYAPAQVLAHDPNFSEEELHEMGFIPVDFQAALKADCVILLAAHDEYKEKTKALLEIQERLVDTTNLIPAAQWKIGRRPSISQAF